MASSVGQPLQLVKQIENSENDDVRFELNTHLFRKIQQAEKLMRSKVCVISVAGAFRKGKSFLLNFFLRFLRATTTEYGGDWMQERSDASGEFHWRAGSERDTTGILVWSEPFFIRRPNGEEVAVLLMDTQGTFDHQSTQKDCATIFGLSTLVSSVQIFNISQNIQESDLQHLRLFVEFAAMAKSSKEKVLQHLWFLVRDWQNADEYCYGISGGQLYLNKVLACDSRKPKENQELRQGIRQHFAQASCCLLPHPGKAVFQSKFCGEVDRLEPEFVHELKSFIPAVASAESLTFKKVNGKELTGKELLEYMEVYFKAFCDGRMPSPKSIFDATVEMANMSAAQEAKEFLENSMTSFFGQDIVDDEFADILEAVRQDAIDKFKEKCMEADSPATRKVREKLQEELLDLSQKQKVLRQLQSEKLSADRKNEMLQQEIGSLQQTNNGVLQEMQRMEENHETVLEDIQKRSISKDEMERLLKEETMRHETARKEMDNRTDNLVRKIEELSCANQELQSQLSDTQKQSQRDFERLLQQQQQEAARLQQRVSELENSGGGGKFCTVS